MKTIFAAMILLCLPGLAAAAAAAQPTATLLSSKKISDQAPHNAFSDMVYWNGQFVCAFREGRKHVSTDGHIRVLMSSDGETWTSAAVVAMSGFDCRDACLSITPDNRLMLNGGVAPREKDNEKAPTGTFVSFSEDGKMWTPPKIAVEPGRWMWRVRWYDGKAYGVAYDSVHTPGIDHSTQLMVSNDGIKFDLLVPKVFDIGSPSETALRFDKDGTMYCIQRRDQKPQIVNAYFGKSWPPYTKWEWHDLGMHVSGPNLLQLPSGKWIAAGRFFDGDKPVTKLATLDVDKGTIQPILTLPSGGDCSYPGLVWHDGVLWISYYSSHEGKTSIYLAKVKLEEK